MHVYSLSVSRRVSPFMRSTAYPLHPCDTWQIDHMVRAVTAPVGYGDGYFRSMSNKAQVILRGKKYPVVGRISMDQIVINIEWESAYNDDEVSLIGDPDT